MLTALVLISCSKTNGFRLINVSASPLVVLDKSRDEALTLAPGEMSRLLLLGTAGRYALERPADKVCRYTYPSISLEAFPLPDGRRMLDGKSPQTIAVVTIDDELVARAYPYRKGQAVEPAAEFRRGGFPARAVQTCTSAAS